MLKQTIALGALAVSLISPATATVEQITTEQSIKAGVPPLLAHLVEAAGVKVYNGLNMPDTCNQHEGRVLGVYHAGHNAMLMCVQNIANAELYVEVFTHEAVHMAQDCRDGIENTTLYPGTPAYTNELWSALPEYKQQNILDNYPKSAYAAEIEAFYFEDHPDKVAEGVMDACF